MRIGVISDTHGLLRPEAFTALQGVDQILHAGDIGREDLIPELEAIAPVTAIRGNVDVQAWCQRYPETASIELGGLRIHMVHSIHWLQESPERFDLIVVGHSHKPALSEEAGYRILNPGSAGRRRFSLPISLAILDIQEDQATISFINLLDDRPLP